MEDSNQPVPDSDNKIIFLSDALTDLKEVANWTLKKQNDLFNKCIKTANNVNIIKCYKKIKKTINTLNRSLADINEALDIEFKKWALEIGYDNMAYEALLSNLSKANEINDRVCSEISKTSVEENDSNKNVKIVKSTVKVDKEVVNKYLENVANKPDPKNKSIYDIDTNPEFENIEGKKSKAGTSDCSSKQRENITLNSGKIEKQSDSKKSSNIVRDTNQTTENVSDSEKDMDDERKEKRKIIRKIVKKSKNKDTLNEQVESENRNKEIDEGEDKNENNEICSKATKKCKGDESKNESVMENPKKISHEEESEVDRNESQRKTIENVDLQIDVENECIESRNKDDIKDSEIGNEDDNTEPTEIARNKTKENETVQGETERTEDIKKIESKDKIPESKLLKDKSNTENKNKNSEIDENEDGEGKSKEITETVDENRKDNMKNEKTNTKDDTDVEINGEKEQSKDKSEEIDEEEVEFEKQGNKLQAEKESKNCEIDKNEGEEVKKKETVEDKKQKHIKKSKKTKDKNDADYNVELIEEKEQSKDKNKGIDEEKIELENEGKKEFETGKILKGKSKQLQAEKEIQNCEIDKNGDDEVKKKETVKDKKQKDKKKSKKLNEKNDTENNIKLNEEKEKSKDKSEESFEEEAEKQETKESKTTKTKDAKLGKHIDELDAEGEQSDKENSIVKTVSHSVVVIDTSFESDAPLVDQLDTKEEELESETKIGKDSSVVVIDTSFESDAPLVDQLDTKEEELESETKIGNDNEKTKIDDKANKKIGIIKLVDIKKLVDKVGFILSPTRDEEPEFIPDKSKKRKSVSFMVEDDSFSSDKKANKSKNKKAPIESITISSDSSDFEPKSNSKRRTTRNSKVVASKFKQLRNLREKKHKKRRISFESDSSDSDSSDSDNSNKLTKETKQNSRQKKQLKYIDKSDPKFHLPCSIVIEKLDLSKPEMYLKRYIDLKEAKSIERLSDMTALKKRKRNAKKASSDVSESVSSDSEKQVSKRNRPPQKKKSKGKSDSDEEMPLGNLKKKIGDDSGDGSDDDAPLKNLKSQVDVPKNDLSEPESVNSPSDSENSSPENNKKKKEISKKKSADKENKSDSDAEKNNGTEKKNDKKKENVDSEDSDFQKKKSWKKDKLLHGKLSETDSDEDKDKKKNKSQKKKKRNRRVLGSDSEAHSDDGSDEEFETKKNKKKKKDSDESSEDSDEDVAKKKKHRRIKEINDSDDSSENEDEDGESGKRRKKIRAVLKDDLLSKTTRDAAKEEQERKKRISDRQKMYNEMYDLALENKAKVDKVVLDFDPETKKELIKVHPDLVEKLKPHQANGVKFMWDACFESLEQTKKDKGSGCILAHCMGLGKTLQVVTLIHTLLTHKKTGVRTVMVVCPLSTVLNWVNEFKIWLDSINDGEDVNIFEISRYKKNYERAYQIKDWQECGGVLILGYEMFRLLSNDANKRIRKKNRDTLRSGLVDPGPDLVVCDEGHLLKNEKSRLSIAMNRLKTMRRIVLTGTPVQNNLREYFCMVQFVKPNLLGKYNEYTNRFVNPITNGQYTDSTPRDIAIMKRRSHVLHKLLDGVVQRRDYAVLAPFLPPKHEYVCFLTLTDIQKKLYTIYMDHQSKRAESGGRAVALFADFQALQRIWTHPRMLKAYSEKYEKDQEKKTLSDESEGSLKDFIDDDDDTSSSESEAVSTSDEKSDDSTQIKSKRKPPIKRRTRASAAQKVDDDGSDSDEVQEVKPPNPTEWWCDYIKEDELDNLKYSAKLILLFDILKKCEQIGDKVLVFSQSLFSLDLIEYFLEKIDEATQNGESNELLAGHSASWALGLDYFRLDGSSSVENRAAWCKTFNDEDNPRARLFLISTKAGGLGINLVAANRVIIFDVSWNPSHDVQSIFRIYRFGQKKPCYVYRFIAMGTMEEKVYERQVTKQAISKRVIDEQQIDRHYNQNDLAELYKFTPEPEGERPIPMLPKDRMFAELLQEHEDLIYRYHEHDSLLENKEEEELDEDERRAAWDEFENEKTAKPATGLMANLPRPSMTPEQAAYALEVMLRNEHPLWADVQIRQMVPAILQQMYQQAIAGDWTLYNRVMSYQVTLQQQVMAAQTRLMNPAALQTVIAANQKAKESQWAAMVKRMQMGATNRPSTSKETRPTPAPRPFDPNEVVNLD